MDNAVSWRGTMRAAALLAAWLAAGAAAAAAEWRLQDVSRVVAVSDVHGARDAFVRTLEASELLDGDGSWRGGDTHLVITGDLLDRGPDSRAVMDLLMRLEEEARQAGGRVHLLLGNHEVMNLVGDLRYVSAGEYEAFAADEDADERDAWFRRYVARAGSAPDDPAVRAGFDRRHPPGLFAHRRAFRPDGRYGAWLLEKPLLLVIDDTAFVHGGLSPMVAELGLDGINRGLMRELREYLDAVATLTDHGALLPGDSFYDHARILESLPTGAERASVVDDAIDTVRRHAGAAIHDPDSPLWYRGTVACSPIVEGARLEAALDGLAAERVVVGHTPTVTRTILGRLDGRVFEIDTGMLGSYYGGSGHALVIEDGAARVVDETGASYGIPRDPRLNNAGTLTAEAVESALRDGALTVAGKRTDGVLDVTVQSGEQRLDAVFLPAPRRGFLPELAAYRLDRMLDLYLVPVTVERTVDGTAGAVQLAPAGLTNEARRAEAGAGASAWCPLPEQWRAMYRFDTLIYKTARTPDQILYEPGRWQLVVTGHADAFGSGSGRPAYLRDVDVAMDAAWSGALAALDDERLDAELAEVLGHRRLRALERRLEALLEP